LNELVKKTVIMFYESNNFFDEEIIDTFNVNSFLYEAFVDIDGYIVNENINFEFGIKDADEINNIQIKINITNYDFNEKQLFEEPKINGDNLLTKEKLKDLIDNGIKIER
jgi:hypothetical protein